MRTNPASRFYCIDAAAYDRSAREESLDSFRHLLGILQLAFPHDKHGPAFLAQPADVLLVPGLVPAQFGDPIGAMGGGNAAPSAVVHMPETAANKNNLPQTRENEVGFAGQRGDMEAKAIAEATDQTTNSHFRRCVRRLYGRHNPRSLGFGECVGHVPILGANGPRAIIPTLWIKQSIVR
jgi:hypothetical protein